MPDDARLTRTDSSRSDDLLHGRYRLEETIERTGHGTIWQAYDTELRTSVCVKQYLDADSDLTEMVCQEARGLERFNGVPGIVDVQATFTEDNVAYLVMELVSGQELSDYVEEGGPLTLDATLDLLKPVFDALEIANADGIFPHDISPGNIRVLEERGAAGAREAAEPGVAPEGPKAKLMDFGKMNLLVADELPDLAKGRSAGLTVLVRPQGAGPGARPSDSRHHPEGDKGVARAHQVIVAVPGYSSPEQRRGLGLTAASNVYSLAATIWYCLTGATPRYHRDDEGNHVVVSPSEQSEDNRSRIDPTQEAELMRALSNEPSKRQQSVAELWDDLQRQSGPKVVREGRRHPLTVEHRPHKNRVRRPPAWAMVVAVVVAGVVVTAGLWSWLRVRTMPDLVGYTQDGAVDRLRGRGIRVPIRIAKEDSDEPEGTVLGQDPGAGESVPAEGVSLTVSDGAGTTTLVPNLLGLTESDARERIQQAGFLVGSVTYEASTSYAGSHVCEQEPAGGDDARSESNVSIVVSEGSETRSEDATVRDALSDYSWSELGDIADEVAAAGDAGGRPAALQVAARYHLVSDDGRMLDNEKPLDVDGETIGMRVVDVYHDDLTGGGKAGLTLMDVDAGLEGPINVEAADHSNAITEEGSHYGWVWNKGGWKDSDMRERLQRLESTLPSDLLGEVKFVSKKTNNVGQADDDEDVDEVVTTTSDVLWIPSLAEVGGEVWWLKNGTILSQGYDDMMNAEGTQYAAFEQAGVKSSTEHGDSGTYGAIAMGAGTCWLRSTSMKSGAARCIVANDPSCVGDAQQYNSYMLGFCL